MIITLVEILFVFFVFGSKWSLDFIVSSFSYKLSKNERFQTSAIILLLYQNVWLFEKLDNVFSKFDILDIISLIITEALFYGLSYLITYLMSFCSKSQTKLIDYPAAFITALLAIPVMNAVIKALSIVIPLIIV